MFKEAISTVTLSPEEMAALQATTESAESVEQRTDEWHAARLGRITASRIADVMAKTKTGYSTSRANYMTELLLERLTGKPTEHFTSSAMQWGVDTEPQARTAYEFYIGVDVVETGFHIHPTIAQAGASPDGLVGDDGLVEIKCPNSSTHLETWFNQEKIARKYQLQMQFQMACTGRQWCDFVSFDPRFPEHLTTFIARVNRDDALINEIEREVLQFLHELDGKINQLTQQEAA